MESLEKKPRRCSYCDGTGHRADRCALRVQEEREQATVRLEIVDDRVEKIARMREECDALATEILEYERVLELVQERLTQNKRRVGELQVAIARARRA